MEARLCDEAKEYLRSRPGYQMHEALHKLNSGEFCDIELGPSQPLAKFRLHFSCFSFDLVDCNDL